MRVSSSRVRVSFARASMPMVPCPTAGRNSSSLMILVACCVSPSRRIPASARIVASTSPESSLRNRVSTLPRSGCTRRSGRRRLAIACRRSEAVPSVAPCGNWTSDLATRLMKTSRGSSRSRQAASIRPRCENVGMSLDECTARSLRPSSNPSSISLVNRPLPPNSASGPSWRVSPLVRMMTSSTVSSPTPNTAASLARTVRACTSAHGLPRVPMRRPAVDCTISPLDARAPCSAHFPAKGRPHEAQMIVLGIETTCDEDAAACGGVVPEIAARAHVETLDLIIDKAMRQADQTYASIDGVAAAAGPGLIGGVIVGLTTAKAIALVKEKPLVAVNHLEAHALTARLTDATPFPYCLFLASGGHTQIVAVRGVGDYVRLGTTMDDAIGEAFDKTAKLLGLGYPGGPQVEKEADRGNATRFALPRPMRGRNDADFSLSGLKTAVRLEAGKIAPLSNQDVADLCASFQQAIVEVVLDRLRTGLRMFRTKFGAPTALVAAGGVAPHQPS